MKIQNPPILNVLFQIWVYAYEATTTGPLVSKKILKYQVDSQFALHFPFVVVQIVSYFSVHLDTL